MRVGLLGPVTVWHDGTALPLGPAMQRAVLALLALDAGRVVPVERLVDGLWGEEPPNRPSGLVQTYVSRLRALLRPAGLGIDLRGNGYVLDVPPDEVDVRAFRALAARGLDGADPAPFRAALALWRGDPLADLRGTPLLDRIRAGMVEDRLVALEACLDRELRAGRHREVLPELVELHEEHPLRERFLGMLLLALYRGGRQADALQRYTDARRRLADELGLDPAPELVALHARILRNDPDLCPEPSPAGPPPRAERAPRLLPYDVRDFTGRAAEVAYLKTLAEDTTRAVVISAIDGMPGVGKTTVAVHVAHALSDRFPDGQLFLDLHGYTPGRTPVDPGAALTTLLRGLGIPEKAIPADPDDRAALWRDELAGRRVLVLLDNAAHAGQIRPLLPGTPGCLVLVTSRRRLTTLDGAEFLLLDVLPPDDALALFLSVAGEQPAGEEEAVAEVLRLCGYLPLALRIAAARIAHRPHRVGRLAAQLRAEHQRLAGLSIDDRDVTAAFNLSYAELDAEQRRLFRLLGTHPGLDFEPRSVAALADRAVEDAENLLDDLVHAHLLQRAAPDRYTFHDLIRVYAADRATTEDGAPERDAALGRLAAHYLSTAMTTVTDAGLRPQGPNPVGGACPSAAVTAPVIAGTAAAGTAAEALAWLDAERANLIATAHLEPRLSPVLARYLEINAHYGDAVVLHTRVVDATRDHPGIHAHALRDLGQALFLLGRYDTALRQLSRAGDTYRALGDRIGEARTLESAGAVYGQRGDLDRSLAHVRLALQLYRAAGERHGEGGTLITLGTAHARLGEYDQAAAAWRQALTVNRELGNRHGEGSALTGLGIVYQRTGQFDLALEYLHQALDLHRSMGSRQGEGSTLNNLAVVYGRLARYPEALDHFERARRLHAEVGNRSSEGQSLSGLGTVHERLREYDQAIVYHERALALSREIGERNLEAQALNSLGETYRARDEPASALDRHAAALQVAQATGDVYAQAQAHEGIGHAQYALGRPVPARASWELALRMYTELGVVDAQELRVHLDALVDAG
ncbi:tetratricopeptide repeat protein [Longispora sp. K20-0274]|uniref:AfsR/SARP family transcriptional regulator n=1 Tax=Longispora sp. K20-0274 TaxID=3088255 RepID=UPI00399BAA9D